MSQCEVCCIKPYKVECLRCKFRSCKVCTETYLLNDMNEPNCMKCKQSWSRKFIKNSLSTLFIDKRLRDHRENVLLDLEKSKLPYYHELADVERFHRNKQLEISNIRKQIQDKTNELGLLREILREHIINNNQDDKRNSRKIKKCSTELCRGYIDHTFACTLCNSQFCPACFDNITDTHNHVCNPDTLQSVNEIIRCSKQCPSCGVDICKVNGCDQMWCILCSKAFSWKTNKVLNTTNLHNPHYFEWLNKYSFEVNDNCNKTVIWWKFVQELQNSNLPVDIHLDKFNLVKDQLQTVMTIIHMNPTKEFEDSGVAYILGDINEQQWKKKLQQIEKKCKKNDETLGIIQAFINMIADIFFEFYNKNNKQSEDLSSMKERLNETRVFFNENMLDLSKLYSKCVFPIITANVDLLDTNYNNSIDL